MDSRSLIGKRDVDQVSWRSVNMKPNWNEFLSDISAYPKDLIEIHFSGLDESSWRSLFKWLNGKIHRLMDQHGVVWDNKMDIDHYMDEAVSYMVTFSNDAGRAHTLLLIDLKFAIIDIEQEEIALEADFEMLLCDLRELASVLQCSSFYMCPESNIDHIVFQEYFIGKQRGKR